MYFKVQPTKTWSILESDLPADLGGEELPSQNKDPADLHQALLVVFTWLMNTIMCILFW